MRKHKSHVLEGGVGCESYVFLVNRTVTLSILELGTLYLTTIHPQTAPFWMFKIHLQVLSLPNKR